MPYPRFQYSLHPSAADCLNFDNFEAGSLFCHIGKNQNSDEMITDMRTSNDEVDE